MLKVEMMGIHRSSSERLLTRLVLLLQMNSYNSW